MDDLDSPSTLGTLPMRPRVEATGLPTEWVRVLDQRPEGLSTLQGYVWLDMSGKVRHVLEHDLEFRETKYQRGLTARPIAASLTHLKIFSPSILPFFRSPAAPWGACPGVPSSPFPDPTA